MYLKTLELTGFKSFARGTTLEFPGPITAIVGPNGSGKSNIKEAVQWVMGEQSLKSLRGKKGEDLIWNGSPHLPRLGRASVTLRFDNREAQIPLEFEEVSLGRRIFRDGTNEYSLNESPVRLKDIVELLARLGLGETKHNIIGQGEVDRILLALPRERRGMLEEALGLRVYQIKKNEAEHRLVATKNNVMQVEALTREIAPHVKFLRLQKQKAETHGEVAEELRILEQLFFAREGREIVREKEEILSRMRPLEADHQEKEKEIVRLTEELHEAERTTGEALGSHEDEERLAIAEQKHRDLEREVGRLEGKLEAERMRLSQPKVRAVDMSYIKEEIQQFLSEMRGVLEEETEHEITREQLLVLVEDLETLLGKMEQGITHNTREESEWEILQNLETAHGSLQEELHALSAQTRENEAARTEARARMRAMHETVKTIEAALRARHAEERDISLAMERLRFAQERTRERDAVYLRGMRDAGMRVEECQSVAGDQFAHLGQEDLSRKINRLRGRLEEIGRIDPEVIREYEETEQRYMFLTRELEDLKGASQSLRELIRELDLHMKQDFAKGLALVREEFNNYFRIIFGGGRANLELVEEQKKEVSVDGMEPRETDEDKEEFEPGVEIIVEMPRKRIRGLQMLSGGERALTSVALLFAMTAVNPPPFLILDETDAALDEANSRRYAAMVGEFAKKTQLVLITHNRETMKAAGVLYGVTMGDDGCSRLLSLKLEQAEAYTNR